MQSFFKSTKLDAHPLGLWNSPVSDSVPTLDGSESDLDSRRSSAWILGSRCSLNFGKKFCIKGFSTNQQKHTRTTHLNCGITLVFLQESRYVYRAFLWLSYVVLHSRIIYNVLWLYIRRQAKFGMIQPLADHADTVLSSLNPRYLLWYWSATSPKWSSFGCLVLWCPSQQ